VADRGRTGKRLTGRRRPLPGQDGGYGLWIAEQLCDRLEARHTDRGTVVRVYMGVRTA
jgi:anti-sigma regulatory factor (Ser/Thr protein kinase)